MFLTKNDTVDSYALGRGYIEVLVIDWLWEEGITVTSIVDVLIVRSNPQC